MIAVALGLLAALAVHAVAQPASVDRDALDDLDFDGDTTVVMTSPNDDGSGNELDAELYARLARSVPSPQQVVAAAYRAAGIDRDPFPALARRAHVSALVPQVTVSGGQDASWYDISNPTIGRVEVFDVSATWHFDRLVFDPSDFRVPSLQASRARERRRLSSRILRTYYRWLVARTVAERNGRASPRVDQASAELDAWTDGWWSQETCQVAKCPSSSKH